METTQAMTKTAQRMAKLLLMPAVLLVLMVLAGCLTGAIGMASNPRRVVQGNAAC
jgi:hypothetical protein